MPETREDLRRALRNRIREKRNPSAGGGPQLPQRLRDDPVGTFLRLGLDDAELLKNANDMVKNSKNMLHQLRNASSSTTSQSESTASQILPKSTNTNDITKHITETSEDEIEEAPPP